METIDPEVRQSSDMDYLQNKTRLGELDLLERELRWELEVKQDAAVEAVIMGQPFDFSGISDAEARLRQVRRAVEALDRRIEAFRRCEFR